MLGFPKPGRADGYAGQCVSLGLFVMLCLLYFLYCKDIFFGMFLYYMYYGKLYPNYRADVL